jgi:hypothetical protein
MMRESYQIHKLSVASLLLKENTVSEILVIVITNLSYLCIITSDIICKRQADQRP